MRIVINDIAVSTGGALSILRDFYQFISTNSEAKKHEWIFLLSANWIDETNNIKVIVHRDKKSWFNKLLFECITGRYYIKKIDPDIVVSFQNTIIFGVKCPQFVYLHQSLHLQNTKKFSFLNKKERKLAIYQHIIGRYINFSLKFADCIFVQTMWMKEAVAKKININKQNIVEIFPDINLNIYRRDKIEYKMNHFFYPAGDDLYKNHECLYKAIQILNKQGISDFNVKLTLEKKDNYPSFSNIMYLGKLNTEEVFNLYNSSVLIFPSYIETIGLPLLEAKFVGSIIFASDTLFAREALGKYENAYFFNPFMPIELANLMKSIIFNQIEIKEPSTSTTEDNPSWRKLLDKIDEFYSQKIKEK